MDFNRYLKMDLPRGQSCFLWGARKAGKSTYLKKMFPKALYIDLLKADIFQHYLRSPEKLRHELQTIDTDRTIIIDEVQKVPALLDEIHFLIEEKKNLTFILCGSSSRKLRSTGANLLGGRAWRSMFLPLCYQELQELNWKKIFNNGLIPSHYLSEDSDRNLSSYIYDYILTEVHLEANLRKKESFARFLDILGFAQGEMINFTNIARDCGIQAKTVRTYFEILEDMYLGYFIYPFRKQSKRQTISETPKFYLFDTGVASYLRRFEFKEMVGIESGKAFEHFIYLELKAYLLLNNKRDEITYWRTKEGVEVDFIVQNQAFEIKITNSIQDRHIKNLIVFGKEFDYTLNIVAFEPFKRVIEKNGLTITIWPVEEFLKELWNGNIIQ
jgi:predicted AAA+ superfamily ATPase